MAGKRNLNPLPAPSLIVATSSSDINTTTSTSAKNRVERNWKSTQIKSPKSAAVASRNRWLLQPNENKHFHNNSNNSNKNYNAGEKLEKKIRV